MNNELKAATTAKFREILKEECVRVGDNLFYATYASLPPTLRKKPLQW